MRCHLLVIGFAVFMLGTSELHAACCYFSAKNADILQPAQKVFVNFCEDIATTMMHYEPEFAGKVRALPVLVFKTTNEAVSRIAWPGINRLEFNQWIIP
jgi:hypothetical protein